MQGCKEAMFFLLVIKSFIMHLYKNYFHVLLLNTTGREFFVGLSKWTNEAGARAVAAAFPEYPCVPIKVIFLKIFLAFSKVIEEDIDTYNFFFSPNFISIFSHVLLLSNYDFKHINFFAISQYMEYETNILSNLFYIYYILSAFNGSVSFVIKL